MHTRVRASCSPQTVNRLDERCGCCSAALESESRERISRSAVSHRRSTPGGPGVCTAHAVQGTRRMGVVAALTRQRTHGRFAETEGQKLELQLREENTALASLGPVAIDEAWYLWCVLLCALLAFSCVALPAPQCLPHGFLPCDRR